MSIFNSKEKRAAWIRRVAEVQKSIADCRMALAKAEQDNLPAYKLKQQLSQSKRELLVLMSQENLKV